MENTKNNSVKDLQIMNALIENTPKQAMPLLKERSDGWEATTIIEGIGTVTVSGKLTWEEALAKSCVLRFAVEQWEQLNQE